MELMVSRSASRGPDLWREDLPGPSACETENPLRGRVCPAWNNPEKPRWLMGFGGAGAVSAGEHRLEGLALGVMPRARAVVDAKADLGGRHEGQTIDTRLGDWR